MDLGADSVESSPRSRGGEPWEDSYAAPSAVARIRLMCSYGGRIVPRPTDKSLCYLGGETRIVVVDRHSSLAVLSERLSRSLLAGHPFNLKYQLPNEDLDSLISVTTDEDLDNMIEEYDRIASSSRSSRLRLFLFPSNNNPESAPSSIGSLLDDSSKSDTWFVDALNSAIGRLPRGFSSDTASVNCLLGLEEDSSAHGRGGGGGGTADQILLCRLDSSGKLPSVSDSPMLDTSSSFGSTSSAPSLSNLPPIRVRADERPPDPRSNCTLEDHFSHVNATFAAPLVSPPISTISPSENPKRAISSDDEKLDKSEPIGLRRPPPPSSKPNLVEAPSTEAVSRPEQLNPVLDPKLEACVPDTGGYRMPTQAPANSGGYSPATISAEQFQNHQFQQQQQQFLHTGPAYIHHSASGGILPMHPYFPIVQSQVTASAPPPPSHPYDAAQVPMYYFPFRPGPSAFDPTKPMAGPLPNTMLAQLASSGRAPTSAAPLQPSHRPPIIHVPATDQAGHAYTGIGYHFFPHQTPHPAAAATMVGYGYDYADPTIYYSQAPQYQAVSSTTAPAIAETQSPPGDQKRTS